MGRPVDVDYLRGKDKTVERSPITPSLYAPDIEKTVAFYEDVFDFTRTGEWKDGGKPVWAEVTREGPKGAARLWFFSDAIKDRPGPQLSGLIYIFVDSVDEEARRIGEQATVRWGPEDMEYGLRELGVEDLNGYLICFAEDV